jgi:predicted O-methyltransferase YrrM
MTFDEFHANRDEFILWVGPETAELLALLVKESRAQFIVEVGSSYGYSTVWLADAARATGGKVLSLELQRDKQRYARECVKAAGLERFVQFQLGDARASLAKIKRRIDFVLLDLWDEFYIPCFDLCYPKMNPGGLIVADNMTFPPYAHKSAIAYQKYVRSKRNVTSVMLDVGAGIEVSRVGERPLAMRWRRPT